MERLMKCGKITPVFSSAVEDSPMGLGMEKLDRDAFDPERVYDKVAALGVKWIRLQSGCKKPKKRKVSTILPGSIGRWTVCWSGG